MGAIPVVRSDVVLRPDPARVVSRAFVPGGIVAHDGRDRAQHVVERVLALSPEETSRTLAATRSGFAARHHDLDATLARRFAMLTHWIDDPEALDPDRRDLLAAYFTHEYAIEAAALTNPSLVPAPDQTGVDAGSLRVVMSLRAIGEGHISSVEFRTGTVDAEGRVRIDAAEPPVHGERRSPEFERELFGAKLVELGVVDRHVGAVLGRVGERFTMAELEAALAGVHAEDVPAEDREHTRASIHWLAASNYELAFDPGTALSQRVIFPAGPSESNGMEDARFVRFEHPRRDPTYYATYTAYDGFHILPQLIETEDFATFRVATLNGPAARNKGLALFPRRDRWALRRPGSPRQREHLPAAVRQRPVLARQLRWSRCPSSPGSSSRSATAGRPSRRRQAGWSSPTGSARCAATSSGRCCSTSRTPPGCSAPCATRCSSRPRQNATGTSPTSCTRAGPWSTTTGSCWPTGRPTPRRPSPRRRSTRCWAS